MNSASLIANQERRFRLACEQIVQLDYKLEYLESRYKKAKRNKCEALRRSHLIQLVVNEELRTLLHLCHQESRNHTRYDRSSAERLRDGEEEYLIQKAPLRAIQLFQKESRLVVYQFKIINRKFATI